MTVLLYILAAVGAVVLIGGGIALAIDAAQTREDMEYYLHTRFPELEEKVREILASFEMKLNNEGFVHKDQYDEDWSDFNDRLDNLDYAVESIIDRINTLDTIYIKKPAYDPKDVAFKITVGDDPDQMSKGTTV